MENVEVMVYENRSDAEYEADVRNVVARGNRTHTVIETDSGFLLERTRRSGRIDVFTTSKVWKRVQS